METIAAIAVPLIGAAVQGLANRPQKQQAMPQGPSQQAQAAVAGPPPDKASFTRNPLGGMPSMLNLSSAMTPEQQRAALASRGLEGQDASLYRSDEAKKYYNDLVSQNVNSAGQFNPDFKFQDVEKRYVQEALGQKINNPNDNASIYSALLRGLKG